MIFAYVTDNWLLCFNVFRMIVCSFACLINFGLIVVVANTRFNQLTAKCLIISQAVINMGINILSVSYMCLNSTLDPSYPKTDALLCYVWFNNWPLYFLVALSSMNFLTQATDRFLAILMPLHYSSHDRVRLVIMYVTIVLIGFGLSISAGYGVFYVKGRCVEYVNSVAAILTSIVWIIGIFFLPVIVNCVMIVLIYRRAMRCNKLGGPTNNDSSAKSGINDLTNRLTKSVIGTVVAQSICMAPNSLYYTITLVRGIDFVEGSGIQVFTSTLFIGISWIIPFIIFSIMRNLQRTSLRLIKKVCCCCIGACNRFAEDDPSTDPNYEK